MNSIKGLKIDHSGDLVVENGALQLVDGDELLRQKVTAVLSTNVNEWFLNWKEGIRFRNILGKHKDKEDLIRNEITQGLLQIDSSFSIDFFSLSADEQKRKATVRLKASNSGGNTIEVVKEWA